MASHSRRLPRLTRRRLSSPALTDGGGGIGGASAGGGGGGGDGSACPSSTSLTESDVLCFVEFCNNHCLIVKFTLKIRALLSCDTEERENVDIALEAVRPRESRNLQDVQ